MVNHGIPDGVLEMMMESVVSFNELPKEEKMVFYTRDLKKKVRFNSNFDLYQSRAANWRDSLLCVMAPDPANVDELPPVCRDITLEYSKRITKLGNTLFELLSEALGLEKDHLIGLGCTEGHVIISHYYPACPEPNLTIGTSPHSDPDFVNVLLQDHIGGLQVRYQHHWVDVIPVPGALVVNIRDLLQVTATLSLAAASAAAGITVLYDRDLGYCKMMDCRKFQISISFAFISWLLIEISSLLMFWLLAMGHGSILLELNYWIWFLTLSAVLLPSVR